MTGTIEHLVHDDMFIDSIVGRRGVRPFAASRKIHTFAEDGVPCAHVGDMPPEFVVINGGQGFMRRQTPRRLHRDLRRIARVLPPNASFALLGYPEAERNAALPALADRLTKLIGRRYGPTTLVGISFGGIVATRIASYNPAIVKRLVLISSAHELSEPGKDLIREQLSNVLAGNYVGLMKSFTTIFRRPWRNALLIIALSLSRRRLAHGMGNPQTIVRYLNALLELPLERADWLSCVQAKTLVIGGEDDQFFGVGAMARSAGRIPDATLHLIKGERHMVMVERASTVAGVVAKWLRRSPIPEG
ncbi:alpha/beta hydrolase [Achromobacter sp. UBA2119]|uniref:alpha/beta fold hydrolase n=1 Tax=Achromobacter sp. UBA2119 TaxID=1945911 RepID=UPI0032E497C8